MAKPAPAPAKPEKQLYEFTEDSWFNNTFYRKGQQKKFYPAQVQFQLHAMKLVAPEMTSQS
ncbi:hypothetical protein [Hyphomicrobium sp. 802]|uniref:hypothetical protein n=1 Tax=Hyphomicrobium sp. 802 TaxID=1112272 RepID=UPI00045E76BD|nr:hypothetical protein [Hyphomicrobium sp. 802]